MPEIQLEHIFDQSAQRIFRVAAAIEQHRRFMPGCKQSTVISAEKGEKGRTIQAHYVLESARLKFRREGIATFVVNANVREITLDFPLNGGTLRAVTRIAETPDGKAKLSSIVSLQPEREGLLRWVPMKPLIKRGFDMAMKGIARHAEKRTTDGPSVAASSSE